MILQEGFYLNQEFLLLIIVKSAIIQMAANSLYKWMVIIVRGKILGLFNLRALHQISIRE